MPRRVISLVAVFAVALAMAPTAWAIGYWNIPGNFCQCAGYGWGAGHHACYVMGPINCKGFCTHHEVRLPCAPQPPYASYADGGYSYDFRGAAPYAPASYVPGSVSNTPAIEGILPEDEPTLREAPVGPMPELMPDTLPLPAESAPSAPTSFRPLFGAPVER